MQSKYDQVVDLLTPQMDNEARRRGLLTPALSAHPRLYERIDWSGAPRDFTTRLVDECLRYGEVESGKPALALVLESVREAVGPDQQSEIDALLDLFDKTPTLLDVQPYRGLEPFGVEHAKFYFGRERMVAQLVKELEKRPFVAVVGPSGCGKSSLVRAGLVTALRKGVLPGSRDWEARFFRPGADPLQALAMPLMTLLEPETTEVDRMAEARKLANHLRDGALTVADVTARIQEKRLDLPRLVLVADQFEELYTRCQDENLRGAFVEALLAAAAEERISVLLTLRADFYNRVLDDRRLGEAVAAGLVNVLPMSEKELQAAVEQPAREVDCKFEPRLVARIVKDVIGEPGNLPLLEFALTELWARRTAKRVLAYAAYEEIGRVKGAIAERAETVYKELARKGQGETVRRILLRLVHYSEGGEGMRHRATLDELEAPCTPRKDVETVLETLVDARLLVMGWDEALDASAVEPAHEAIIKGWPRLREWIRISEEYGGLRTHRRLTEAAKRWEESERDNDYLYRGSQLANAIEWAEVHGNEMNRLEREFFEASLAFEKREQAKERANVRLIAGLACVAVVLALVALVLFWGADRARREAERQRNISRSQAIAAVARDQLDVDAERSLLLAMEAISMAHTFEAENVLREALIESRVRATLASCGDSTSACAVNDVAWSPDGAWLAMALSDGRVQLWNADNRQLTHTLETNLDAVSSLSWNSDSKQLAFGSSDGSVRLWNVEAGKSISTLVGLASPVNSVAWSPDGAQLALGSSDGSVRLCDIETETGESITITMLVGPTDPVKRIASRSTDVASAWTAGIDAVAWSPDGQKLAFIASDNLVQVWHIQTRKTMATLVGHELAITDIAWSPDGRQLASASYDRTVRLWDVETGDDQSILTEHEFVVFSVAWSPDGMRLATGSCAEFDGLNNCLRGESRLLDAQTRETLAVLSGHTGSVVSVAWRPDSVQLASASSDGTVRLWDAETGESSKTLTGHTGIVLDVAWNPDGTRVASASGDKTIRIWSITSTLSTAILNGHEGSVSSVAWSPDGTQLASASVDETVRLWEAKTGRNIATLPGHTAPVNDVAWSPDGMYFASASDDHTVHVWSTQTYTSEHVLKGHEASVKGVAWSADSKQLVSASCDKIVRFWDIETGQETDALRSHRSSATSVTWSPDGRRIALALEDNTIWLWDVETRQNTLILSGHERLANEVAWSPDGRYLATAAEDRTVRLWDAKTGECIAKLRVHKDWVTSVAWSPDGGRLASSSFDHRVRLFYAQHTDLMDIAREQVTRQLSPEERLIYLGEESLVSAP